MASYKPRVIDLTIANRLRNKGAILVEGAKWCGKTTTCEQHASSILYMSDPDRVKQNLQLADISPRSLLQGETPRLIDEWQMAPVLWDAVRFEVDKRNKPGQFILTGSAVPSDNLVAHTGTGRISRLLMRPMSLWESGDSNGSISLKELFDKNTDISATSNLSIEKIAFLICRGGWPASVSQENESALKMATNYVESVINMDVQRVDGVEKNPERVRMLLRSLARNISTMVSGQTIMADMESNDIGISEKTLSSYLNALRRIFVIEDTPAWMPSLRSKTAIRTSPKRNFVDPSIATAVMRTNPSGLLNDFETFGFMFESLCTRDMRIYAQANDGAVFHYRDKNELESDMIISLRDGRWAPVEVKLGNKQIDEAAKNLLFLQSKINTEKMGKPSFLMVVTGGEFAYTRDDGVLVVPIGCLKV